MKKGDEVNIHPYSIYYKEFTFGIVTKMRGRYIWVLSGNQDKVVKLTKFSIQETNPITVKTI
jgi:hypothetical protein